MRASVFDDDAVQVARIDQAIAAFQARSAAEQGKGQFLLAALQTERVHILKYNRRAGRKPVKLARSARTPLAVTAAAASRGNLEAVL
jgi:hypothetical protein